MLSERQKTKRGRKNTPSSHSSGHFHKKKKILLTIHFPVFPKACPKFVILKHEFRSSYRRERRRRVEEMQGRAGSPVRSRASKEVTRSPTRKSSHFSQISHIRATLRGKLATEKARLKARDPRFLDGEREWSPSVCHRANRTRCCTVKPGPLSCSEDHVRSHTFSRRRPMYVYPAWKQQRRQVS